MINLETNDEAETRALGASLAKLLAPGDFVGLVGELGAGKTLLSRAICEALGVDPEEIASPTFSIVNRYEGERFPVHHADLYRISDYDELYATGFLDLIEGDAVSIVEWIDRVPDAAPEGWLRLELLHESPSSRRILIRGFGPRGKALEAALTSSLAIEGS